MTRDELERERLRWMRETPPEKKLEELEFIRHFTMELNGETNRKLLRVYKIIKQKRS